MAWYWIIMWIILSIIIVALLGKLFVLLTTGSYKIRTDLSGKIIHITGATGGIGRDTALELARHGAIIHLLCRNTAKAESLASEIREETDAEVHVWEIDVSSLQSVKHFVRRYNDSRPPGEPIDILINNAGCGWFPKREVTSEGLEMTMATNHFGHFLLTNLMLDRLKLAQQGRIVNVASMAHWPARRPDLTDLNFARSYSQWNSYNVSKLANILFTNELAVKLADTNVTAYSLHPGCVRTDLFRHWDWYLMPVYAMMYVYMKSSFEGAQTTLYCAVAPELSKESGKYYSDCSKAMRSPLGADKQLSADFWRASAEVVGLEK